MLKAAYLLCELIPGPRGLACITDNNEAVAEFRRRLEVFGIKSSGRVFLGTVHSFCLNCMIRPFAHLAGSTAGELEVAPESTSLKLLSKAANEVGPDVHPFDLQETITKLRSRLACGEDCSGFGDTDFEILEHYRKLLIADSLLDLEGNR